MTGDVVPVMSTAEARRYADYVRRGLDDLRPKVVAMYLGKAWLSLGYTSWDDLREGEWGGSRIDFPIEERRQAVAELTQAGLSTREIAGVVGVSREQVRRDQSGDTNVSPEPRPPVQGLDGKTYRRAPVIHITDAGEVPDEEVQEILDRFIDEDTGVQRARINRRIAGHATALAKVCLTDPDDIAAGDHDAIESLLDSADAVNRWADKIRAATTAHTRTLRVITPADNA